MKVGVSELRSRQGKPEPGEPPEHREPLKSCPGGQHGLHPTTHHMLLSTFKALCRCCVRIFWQINQSWLLYPQNLNSHTGVRNLSKQIAL